MAKNNNLTSELSKLNKDLDKHLTDISVDVTQFDKFNTGLNDSQAVNFEVLTFLQDVRDEMSLLRKHLFNDVQSLVTKTLRAEQDQMLAQMQKQFNSVLKDIVDSKNHHMMQLRNEQAHLELEVSSMKTTLEHLNSKIDKLVQHVYEDSNRELSYQNELDSRLIEIENELLVNQHKLEGIQGRRRLSTLKPLRSRETFQIETDEDKLIEHRIARIDAALNRLQ